MPPPSKLLALPPETLDQLDDRLRATNFMDYGGHAQWLASKGHSVGKSSIHAYATRNRARIKAAVSRPTAAAQTFTSSNQLDQRVECFKAAAMTLPPEAPFEKVAATADRIYRWASRE